MKKYNTYYSYFIFTPKKNWEIPYKKGGYVLLSAQKKNKLYTSFFPERRLFKNEDRRFWIQILKRKKR